MSAAVADSVVLGSWVLTTNTLAATEPGNTATYEIVSQPLGETEPNVHLDEIGISFYFQGGRRVIWPWTSLLRADYEPVK